jgi:Putative zinc-finger
MTTPMLMTQHPTEELLAEYVDNKLDSAARPAVTDHLASCGECREIVLMATDYQASEESANVTHGTFGRRSWMAAVAGLGVAAAIAIVVLPGLGPDIDDVIQASQSLDNRPSPGRFAERFEYKPANSVKRGSNDGSVTGSQAPMLELQVKLTESKSPDPHLLGLIQLHTARDVQETRAAVESLQTAYDNASDRERDAKAIDLAASLLARARWSGDEKDYERVLELLKQKQSPEALFNRAVALESLQRDSQAIRAWDDYLKVDSTSEWGQEAKRKKDLLESYR